MSVETVHDAKGDARAIPMATFTEVLNEQGELSHYKVVSPRGVEVRYAPDSYEIQGVKIEVAAAIVDMTQTDTPLNVIDRVDEAFKRRGIKIEGGPEKIMEAFVRIMQQWEQVEAIVDKIKIHGLKQAAIENLTRAIQADKNMWNTLSDPTKQAAQLIIQGLVMSALTGEVSDRTVATATNIAQIDAILQQRVVEKWRLRVAGTGLAAGGFFGGAIGATLEKLAESTKKSLIPLGQGIDNFLPDAAHGLGRATGKLFGSARDGFQEKNEVIVYEKPKNSADQPPKKKKKSQDGDR
jgi:hypothetical protein